MLRSLVGSEMCIRDSFYPDPWQAQSLPHLYFLGDAEDRLLGLLHAFLARLDLRFYLHRIRGDDLRHANRCPHHVDVDEIAEAGDVNCWVMQKNKESSLSFFGV